MVDDVAESLETLRLNVLADCDSELVFQAAKTLREAAQRSVRPEAPPDSIQEPVAAGFGSGVSDTLVVDQSQMARLNDEVITAPRGEQLPAVDDVEEFGVFMGDDNRDDNHPFDDPFGLATAEAPSPVAAPVAAREGGLDLDDIFFATFPENDAAAPVPAAAAPAPAPPAALDAMTPEQVAGELAALGVPIDEAAATNSPVSLPLFRIARAAAEAAQREEGRTRRGKWESPEPDIADSLNDAFTRRRLPLTTGASARAFLATVLSCSGDRITGKYRGRSLPGPYVGQEASAPDLAALASALEAFVAPFATSLQERPASASIVHDGGYGVDGVQRRARSRSSSPRAVPAPVAPGGTAVDQTNFPVVAAPPRPAPRPTEAGTVPEQAHSRRRGTAPRRTGSATGPRVRTNNNVACPCRHAG